MKRLSLLLASVWLTVGGTSTFAAIPSYTETEVVISSDGAEFGNCALGATLLVPLRPAHALVVFVHGSGAQDRDETFPGGYTPFKDIAEFLSSSGIATLRFDKRTSIAACLTALKPHYVDFTPEIFIRDVENVVAYTQTRPELSPLPLVLLGHSQGVNFVLDIAGRNPEVEGTILMAGLGKYAIDTTILRQYEWLVQTNKFPEQTETLKQQLADARRFFPTVRDGTAKPTDQFLSAHTRFWSEWIRITDEAAQVAAASPAPSLLVQGDRDWNVTLEDFRALKSATAHVPGSRARLFPGIFHSMTTETSTRVAPEVLEELRDWVLGLFP